MIFNSASLIIQFDEKLHRLELHALHRISTKDFKEGLLNALNFAERNNIKHWLLDFREIGTLNEKEEKWLDTVLFPKMMMSLRTGNYMAIVLSENCYTNLLNEAGKYGLQSYNSFIIINTFCDLQKANDWLHNSSIERSA